MKNTWNIILIIIGLMALFLNYLSRGYIDYFGFVGLIFIIIGLYRIIKSDLDSNN